jgi:hypothetical protein
MTDSIARSSQSNLDAVVVDLRHLCRSAAVDLSFQIGKLIVDSLFDGNLDRWMAEGTKHIHYRELSKRPDLPLSASALCRSVGIYALCRQLEGYQDWKHIGPGHLQEVLTLSFADQARILDQAERECWTVKRLRGEVAQLRPRGEGRRRRHAFARILKDVRAYLAKLHDSLHAARTESLNDESAQELRETIALLNDHRDLLEETLNVYEHRPSDAKNSMSETRLVAALPASRERSSK